MPIDRNGVPITLGEHVIFEKATEDLLRDLPAEDQLAIRTQVGKVLEVKGFNDQGNPELEFVDQAGVLHSIWVENSCVLKATP